MTTPRDSSNREPTRGGFDTTQLLRKASEQAAERGFDDVLIIDVDAHHYETEAFREIAQYIDDPVMRQEALFQGAGSGGIMSDLGNYQSVMGRITRYPGRRQADAADAPSRHHFDTPLDGRDGRRLRLSVPDPDAGARQLPAHRNRGRPRPRL